MKRIWIRSTIFNVLFFVWTAALCILYIPTMFLPRSFFLRMVGFYLRGIWALEHFILNLHLEIRGLENLPKEGSYIIAAKHQSTYETLKLHVVFDDPAVILKKELLRIPFWGQYLAKADVIAIDRSSPDAAIQSIQNGAQHVKGQGRPIVIFPQGTRVWLDATPKDKPYKVGIARIQEATDLPIVPMALNTGMFWPRGGWAKSSGTVVFEFMEPIAPGMERSQLVFKLEQVIEERSEKLMDEALKKNKNHSGIFTKIFWFAAGLFALYTLIWFGGKHSVYEAYLDFPAPYTSDYKREIKTHSITGFPFKMFLHAKEDYIQTQQGSLKIKDLRAETKPLPLPTVPVHIQAKNITLQDVVWKTPITLDILSASLKFSGRYIEIYDGRFRHKKFGGGFSGTINPFVEPPEVDIVLQVRDPAAFIDLLVEKNIIAEKMKVWAIAGLGAFSKGDFVEIPIKQKNGTIYAGSFPVYKMAKKTRTLDEPIQRQRIVPVRPDP